MVHTLAQAPGGEGGEGWKEIKRGTGRGRGIGRGGKGWVGGKGGKGRGESVYLHKHRGGASTKGAKGSRSKRVGTGSKGGGAEKRGYTGGKKIEVGGKVPSTCTNAGGRKGRRKGGKRVGAEGLHSVEIGGKEHKHL